MTLINSDRKTKKTELMNVKGGRVGLHSIDGRIGRQCVNNPNNLRILYRSSVYVTKVRV